MLCSQCSSSDFRISRLHRVDVARLFQLQYPVRCRQCLYRQHTGILSALRVRSTQRPSSRKDRTGVTQSTTSADR